MTKSFKDNYTQFSDKDKEQVLKPEDIIVEEVKEVEVETVAITAGDGIGREMTVLEEEFVRVDLTESIENILTEQREQTAKVLESVLKTNTKIANNVAKHVKASADTNVQLAEAIIGLTEKIGLLEAKLEAIEHLEIPTPIVQVQMPNKSVDRVVHRDGKGLVTHITESEISDDKDE
jgi:hypothetical protein